MASVAAPNDSADEIPPLAFDSEDELRAVLDRLRADLAHRIDAHTGTAGDAGNGKGKGKAGLESDRDRSLASDLVLKVSSLNLPLQPQARAFPLQGWPGHTPAASRRDRMLRSRVSARRLGRPR